MNAKVINNEGLENLLKVGDILKVQNIFFANDGNYLKVPCENGFGFTWALAERFEITQ